MQKISVLLVLISMIFAGCKPAFKKGDEGLEYKIITDGKGDKLKFGDFMQLHVAQYYSGDKKDTLLTDSRDGMPFMEMLDSVTTPPAYYKILTQLRKGDSLVVRLKTDSVFSKMPDNMPPYMKKGQYLLTTVKVIDIFKNRAQADSARSIAMAKAKEAEEKRGAEQLAKDDKILKEYFAKNNINPVKTEKGTYVEIIQPGTGANIDTTNVVVTNYTGKTMDGKTFDSNTDPAFQHVQPFNVNLTSDYTLGSGVIKGWSDGLKLLNKGAKAKFYIPSSLAYGSRGMGEKIPGNAILFFDIEVVDVLTKEQAKAAIDAETKKRMEIQKHFTDSISKLKKDTTSK
jgi:FKBP-type peptidyl-prolyl cis-trans isomerase FkpA